MAGLRAHRRLPLALAILAIALAANPATAQQPLRIAPTAAGDAKSVQFAADAISTWTESGEQAYLLRGRVLIEQGILQLRSDQAVLWVKSSPAAFRVALVADGNVRVEVGANKESAPQAVAELASKQGVRARPGATVIEQPQGGDAFVVRARTLRPADGIRLAAAADGVPPPPQFPDQPAEPAPGLPPTGTTLPTAPIPGASAPVPTLPPAAAEPPGPSRSLSFAPRSGRMYDVSSFVLPNGERATLLSGGVILTVRNVQQVGLIDIETDRLVFWSRGGDSQQLFDRMKTPEGQVSQEVEFYMEGNVEIRSKGAKEERTLRADRVYYDVHRNVAVAVEADLELRRRELPDALHLKAEELLQISPTRFEAARAEIFSSRLPSDPGLKLVTARAVVEQRTIERHTIFGNPIVDSKTGKPQTYTEELVRGESVFLRLEDIPVFYLPVIQGDARDPLGPLRSIGFKQDRIFGQQVNLTFDVWNLLNREPIPGTRWNTEFDYLTRRGPAAGSVFSYDGRDLFGLDGPFRGNAQIYGIFDHGVDKLGGGRGEFEEHPLFRGRALARHQQTFLDDFTVQAQASVLSDKNFLEQYYKPEFDVAPNQETFVYLKQQRNIWSWSALGEARIRDWVTETEWLPRGDGAVTGFSFLNLNDRPLFTYNLIGSAGYAQLRTSNVPPPPIYPTDVPDQTGRFDVRQELSMPTYLGPVRFVPYGVLDTTYYTNNLQGDGDGRLYGGGGLRASMPLSRTYPNVHSELFNLNGINHKIVFGGNYFIAHSSDPSTDFPLLDRLNDDATDQALRDVTPQQPFMNPANGLALRDSPVYNPQLYAIRRLVDNSVDTLDTIEVLQLDMRQRWQTKRGFPGQEHVVDYFTLDLSGSLFPHPQRDNFGSNVGFLEYDATWNVGDRTALVSTGWVDPFNEGARVFTVGAFLNRTDRTSFFLGYRYIDPIDSRAFTASTTYIFSPKYAITASSTYDFGIQASLANSLVVTRIGSDISVSAGFTYNAILNNFGFTFEVLPNLIAMNRRTGNGPLGSGLFR